MKHVYVLTVKSESSEKARGQWEVATTIEEIYQSLSTCLYEIQSLRDLPHRVIVEMTIKRVEVPEDLYRQYFRKEEV